MLMHKPTVKQIFIIGYGGHGYVVIDILRLMQREVTGYCDIVPKQFNPYGLEYLGSERALSPEKREYMEAFISVGDNDLRRKLYEIMSAGGFSFCNALHPSAVISSSVQLGSAVMVAAGTVINPQAKLGNGVICNTGSIIEHECTIGEFSHIAPGAVLCGNVSIGKNCFIGANAVVIEGISIADNVRIGAGSTVVKNIVSPGLYYGSPATERTLRKK